MMKKKTTSTMSTMPIKVDKKVDLCQETLIGNDTYIKGDLSTDKSVRIDGSIEGNIGANQCVTIGEGGFIKGNIKAERILIYGKVEGEVEATAIVEIMQTGKLYGNSKSNRLVIQEGAIFCGESQMDMDKGQYEQEISE